VNEIHGKSANFGQISRSHFEPFPMLGKGVDLCGQCQYCMAFWGYKAKGGFTKTDISGTILIRYYGRPDHTLPAGDSY
jgi:hypothetical protein